MRAAALPFLEHASHDRPLLRDDNTSWIGAAELTQRAKEWQDGLGRRADRGLTFIAMNNTVESVAALLGTLAAGRCVALVSPRLTACGMAELTAAYAPDEIIAAEAPPGYAPAGATLWRRQGPALVPPHDDCAVLLSTSGSTASPKMVRLRLDSLRDNADAIAERLDIAADDVAWGHLPLDYSYGLSVLTSHLARGAAIALTRYSMMERAFWDNARQAGITHLPGVPTHHRMLARLGLHRLNLPSLRSMTQAGGRLELELQDAAHAFMQARGGFFHVMYGQTEASPRMTTLRHEDFPGRRGSVGTALRGGRLRIDQGEVIYEGANVMMGYARCRDDLALPDQMGGVLRTGDGGTLDPDGFLTLSGRLNRLAKVQGWRLDLDEVEATLAAALGHPVAALDLGESVRLVVCGPADAVRAALAEHFALPPHVFEIVEAQTLPLLANGKTDYATLRGAP